MNIQKHGEVVEVILGHRYQEKNRMKRDRAAVTG